VQKKYNKTHSKKSYFSTKICLFTHATQEVIFFLNQLRQQVGCEDVHAAFFFQYFQNFQKS
jgi:hypothetical protein